MPTFYNYALNDMEESQINDAKRRVTGYNNNQTERLSSKPEEDPTNGLIDIQLSRLTDEIYLAGKEIDNLDSYLQIDTSLIVMNAGIPSAIKKTIQDSVRIYISINQSVEKIRRTYRTLSKNIKFASLHIWTDFTAAVNILFKQNLVLNDIVDKFVNDYRAAIGQPPVDIRRPDRIEEEQPPPGDGGDDDDGGDGGDEGQPPPPEGQPPPPPPEEDPTDPDSEPSFDARTQVDEDELQDTLGVDTALPPAQDLPQVSFSRPTLSRPRPDIPQLPLGVDESIRLLADQYNFDADPARRKVLREAARLEDAGLEGDFRSEATLSAPPTARRPSLGYEPFLTPAKINEKLTDLTKKEEKLYERFTDMFEEDGTTLSEGESQKMADLLEKQIMNIQEQIERLKSFRTPEALPPPSPLPAPQRKPIQLLSQFPLRTDTIPRTPVSDSGSPRPLVRGEEEEDVDYADTWPDLIEETSSDNVWPTIAGLAEDALTLDDIEDLPFWPDIADQEGFRQRFLANRQNRRLGKIVGRASAAYAAAWKTLAGSRTPRTFAQFLGKEKNKKMKVLVDKGTPVGQRTIVRI